MSKLTYNIRFNKWLINDYRLTGRWTFLNDDVMYLEVEYTMKDRERKKIGLPAKGAWVSENDFVEVYVCEGTEEEINVERMGILSYLSWFAHTLYLKKL